MGCEKGSQFAVGTRRQILHNGPGQSHAVIGACAAADFIQNNQAAAGGLPQDARGFHHFHHEGALALCQIVRGPHPAENFVGHADDGGGGGDHAAHLRQQADDGHLTQNSGFSGHVGAGKQAETPLFIQRDAVGHKGGRADHGFHNRMPPVADLQIGAVVQHGAAPAVTSAGVGEALPVVQMGQHVRHEHKALALGRHQRTQLLKQGVFQRLAAVGGGKDVFFQRLEFGRGEAFGIGQRLPPDEVLRHGAGIGGAADFIIIAEDAVIAHFELGDTGGFLLFFK